MREKLELTEKDGYEALRAHIVSKAQEARATHGPDIEGPRLEALLADDTHLRFPTRLLFEAEGLLPGEFAFARARGDKPSDGYDLLVHPALEERPRDAALAAAYHIVTINYLDVATSTEAELYGAALHGLTVDEYYRELCRIADELTPPSSENAEGASAVAEISSATSARGSCGGACSCHPSGGRPGLDAPGA